MIPVLAGKRRTQFGALVAVAAGRALVGALLARCIQHLFERLTQGPNAQPSAPEWIVAAVGAAAMLFLLEAGQKRLTEGMGNSYAADVRLSLFQHMLRLSPRSVLRRRPGVLMLPFVGDLTSLRQWVSDGLARNVSALGTTGFLLAWIAFESAWLALGISVVFAVFAGLALALARPLNRSVREVRRRRGALSGFVSGRLAAIATIASMARERTEVRKVSDRVEALNDAVVRRAWLVGVLRGLVHVGSVALVLTTLLVGGFEVSAGRLTAGTVVGVLSLVTLLSGAMRDLGRAFELWIPGRVARERIERILAEPVRTASRSRRTSKQQDGGLLSIEGLRVGDLLADISAHAGDGEVVLVDGPGGSGKSTLISVIAGLVGPDAGQVLIHGKRLSDLPAARARQTIGLASPLLPLLPGSLGMNIRYRSPHATAEEIADLTAQLGLDSLINRQSSGLDTVIADVSADLSTGEYQALLVARAVLGHPPILLLDSIDSHLSPEVLSGLADLIKAYPGVVLMSATRPPLTTLATVRWRLEGGRLQATGAVPSIVSPTATSDGVTRRDRGQ